MIKYRIFIFSACKSNQTVTDARLLIEVIKLLGTVSKDENCGELLYEHGTIQQVINLLKSNNSVPNKKKKVS